MNEPTLTLEKTFTTAPPTLLPQSDSLTVDKTIPQQTNSSPVYENRLTPFGTNYDTALQVAEWNDQFRWGPKPDEAELALAESVLTTPEPSTSPIEVIGIFGQHTKEKAEKLLELKQHLIELLGG